MLRIASVKAGQQDRQEGIQGTGHREFCTPHSTQSIVPSAGKELQPGLLVSLRSRALKSLEMDIQYQPGQDASYAMEYEISGLYFRFPTLTFTTTAISLPGPWVLRVSG